jgi:hypothetical protein
LTVGPGGELQLDGAGVLPSTALCAASCERTSRSRARRSSTIRISSGSGAPARAAAAFPSRERATLSLDSCFVSAETPPSSLPAWLGA